MSSEQVQKTIRQLSLAYCWMVYNTEIQKRKDSIVKKFQRKIDNWENFLVASGHGQDFFDEIKEKARKFLEKDAEKMTHRQFYILAKVVFT